MTTVAVLPDQRCFLQAGCADIDNFQFVTGFRFLCPGFPIYPESAYLLTDFFSGANTRKIRGFYKILDINDLYLRDIFSFSKKHHIALRNRPFRGLKCTILHPKIGLIAP